MLSKKKASRKARFLFAPDGYEHTLKQSFCLFDGDVGFLFVIWLICYKSDRIFGSLAANC